MAAANSNTRTRNKTAGQTNNQESEGNTEATLDAGEPVVQTMSNVTQLLPSSVQPEEFFPVLTAQVKAGTPRAHLWLSEFWVSVVKNLRPMMEVKVKYQDCSYYARAIVTSISGGKATFRVLEEAELNDVSDQVTVVGDYKVKYCGLEDKHCVIRVSDNVKMRKNIDSNADAIAQAAGLMNGQ